MDISEARKQINRLDKRLAADRVIYVTKHGKKAFAIVDIEYLKAVLDTIDIMSNPDSFKLFQMAIEDIKCGRVELV